IGNVLLCPPGMRVLDFVRRGSLRHDRARRVKQDALQALRPDIAAYRVHARATLRVRSGIAVPNRQSSDDLEDRTSWMRVNRRTASWAVAVASRAGPRPGRSAGLDQPWSINPKSGSPVDWSRPPLSSVIGTSARSGQFRSVARDILCTHRE